MKPTGCAAGAFFPSLEADQAVAMARLTGDGVHASALFAARARLEKQTGRELAVRVWAGASQLPASSRLRTTHPKASGQH